MQFLELDVEKHVDLPARCGLPPTVHVFDARSVDAINAALAANRPLLVRGEPGTGKSQLARAAAEKLNRQLFTTVIDARTEARDLLWNFDAVGRLAEAQVQGALGVKDEGQVRENLREERFLEPGPLWWAFDWAGAQTQAETACVAVPVDLDPDRLENGTVLLIDEIDKADSAVPNGLLESLGAGRFSCPGGQEVVRTEGTQPPLVILTTNEERALPDAFLRRCLVLQLRWPGKREKLIQELVRRGRAHFPQCAGQVLEDAAAMVAEDREKVSSQGLYPPGGAEYLDLLRALTRLSQDESAQKELLQRLGRFVLDKHPEETRW